jgi:hypothetical protein
VHREGVLLGEDDEHLWHVVLDPLQSERTGRSAWTIAYAGPVVQCVGWVLSSPDYAGHGEQVRLCDPAWREKRPEFWRESPSAWELVEIGRAHPSQRTPAAAIARPLSTLEIAKPGLHSRAIESRGNPFFVLHNEVHDIGNGKHGTKTILCVRNVSGMFYTIHHCRGTSIESSVIPASECRATKR